MDVFAHTLWGVAGGEGLKRKIKKPISVGWSAFWGAFPDLFAFLVPMILFLSAIAFGDLTLNDLPRGNPKENPENYVALPYFGISKSLYNLSHSLVIFALGFLFIIWLRKKFFTHKRAQNNLIPYEMLGWPLHIFLDIPTHQPSFYPTPVFWPISDWKFIYGFSWGEPWFMMLNYSALLIILGYFFWTRKIFKN